MSDKVNMPQTSVAPASAFSTRKYGRYSDLVEEFQVTRQTIHRWSVKDPTFPKPFKRGNTVIFDMAAVEAWLSGKVA